MSPQPPVSASSIPARRRATPARVLWAVIGIGLSIPVVVFLFSGLLLVTALAAVPLAIAILAIAANRPRRDERTGDDRDTGLDANPAGSGAVRAGPRGGTYQ
jgi:hypothetical protein